MLTITIPGTEFYDESTMTFSTRDDIRVEMEHSLVSISRWESKWEKPFISKTEHTEAEVFDYLQMMCLNVDLTESLLSRFSKKNMEAVRDYISSKQTATFFSDDGKTSPHDNKIITSELIYSWMTMANVPMECQHWHLNRLIVLIRTIEAQQNPKKPRSAQELAARNRELNAQRRAELNTRG